MSPHSWGSFVVKATEVKTEDGGIAIILETIITIGFFLGILECTVARGSDKDGCKTAQWRSCMKL